MKCSPPALANESVPPIPESPDASSVPSGSARAGPPAMVLPRSDPADTSVRDGSVESVSYAEMGW